MSRPLNSATLIRELRDKFNVSFAGGVLEKPLIKKPESQPPPPSSEEMQEVIFNHKKRKAIAAEQKQLQELNSPQRGSVLKGTNHEDVPELLVLSLKCGTVIEKEREPYKGCRIHNQIFGVFKALGRSGKKRFETRS